MAVVKVERVECDMQGCYETKNLKRWGIRHPDGAHREVDLCTEHRRYLHEMWRKLKNPRLTKPRKQLVVYDDLSQIPRN